MFKGRVPKISDRLIGNENCTVAKNCDFSSGRLSPVKGKDAGVTMPHTGTLKSVYKNGSTWYGWTADNVSVVKASDNEAGHIYYTDGALPKQTNTADAAGTYPPVSFDRFGVEQPATAPASWQLTPASTGGDIFKVVSYVYTYVTDRGEESAPSPPSGNIELEDGQTVIWTNSDFAQPTGSYNNIVSFRLYRLNTGTNGAEYQLVPYVNESDTDFPLNFTTFTDNVGDDDLLEVLATEEFYPPPNNLQGLCMFRRGILAGFSGKTVYLSEPGSPHAFPYDYSFPDTIIGIASVNGALAVITDGRPGMLHGFDPAGLAQDFLPYDQPGVSAKAITATADAVLYASPYGIFAISANSGTLVSSGLFSKDQWQALTPGNMLFSYYNNRLYVLFTNGATGFYTEDFSSIVDVSHGLASIAQMIVVDEKLYLLSSNKVYDLYGGSVVAFEWVSKVFMSRKKSAYTHFQVIADGSINFYFYRDGALVHSGTVTEGTVHRLTQAFKNGYVQIKLTGSANVDSVAVGSSPDEVFYG